MFCCAKENKKTLCWKKSSYDFNEAYARSLQERYDALQRVYFDLVLRITHIKYNIYRAQTAKGCAQNCILNKLAELTFQCGHFNPNEETTSMAELESADRTFGTVKHTRLINQVRGQLEDLMRASKDPKAYCDGSDITRPVVRTAKKGKDQRSRSRSKVKNKRKSSAATSADHRSRSRSRGKHKRRSSSARSADRRSRSRSKSKDKKKSPSAKKADRRSRNKSKAKDKKKSSSVKSAGSRSRSKPKKRKSKRAWCCRSKSKKSEEIKIQK